MLNRSQHQTDQSSCCQYQHLCFPAKFYILLKHITCKPGIRKENVSLIIRPSQPSRTLQFHSVQLFQDNLQVLVVSYQCLSPCSKQSKNISIAKSKYTTKASYISYTYVIVIIPLSLSVWIRMSRSTASFES